MISDKKETIYLVSKNRKLFFLSLLIFIVESFKIKFHPSGKKKKKKKFVLFTIPRQNLVLKSFNYVSLYHLFN